MKEEIKKILGQTFAYTVENDKVAQELLDLFSVSGSYCKVADKEPPHNTELIAKAPNGTVHLTSWRSSYGIFTCQCKTESAFDWEWKEV